MNKFFLHCLRKKQNVRPHFLPAIMSATSPLSDQHMGCMEIPNNQMHSIVVDMQLTVINFYLHFLLPAIQWQ